MPTDDTYNYATWVGTTATSDYNPTATTYTYTTTYDYIEPVWVDSNPFDENDQEDEDYVEERYQSKEDYKFIESIRKELK